MSLTLQRSCRQTANCAWRFLRPSAVSNTVLSTQQQSSNSFNTSFSNTNVNLKRDAVHQYRRHVRLENKLDLLRVRQRQQVISLIESVDCCSEPVCVLFVEFHHDQQRRGVV